MRGPSLGGAAAALLAAPLTAQEMPASADLLATFRTRCAEASADPRAAVNAVVGSEGDVAAAMTSDGAMAQITEPLAGTGDDLLATFFFTQLAFEGGAQQSCVLTLYLRSGDRGPAFPDMADLLAAEADVLLGGPARRGGGPVMSGGEVGQMLVWHAGESHPPAAVLTLTQGAAVVSVALLRLVPAAG